jgi:hypothetical protein
VGKRGKKRKREFAGAVDASHILQRRNAEVLLRAEEEIRADLREEEKKEKKRKKKKRKKKKEKKKEKKSLFSSLGRW